MRPFMDPAICAFAHARKCRYYQAQNEAAKQRFIAGGIASWHEHQERKVMLQIRARA